MSWHPDGHAWVVFPERLRAIERAGGHAALDRYLEYRVAPSTPLDLPGYRVIGLGSNSHLHLPDYKVVDPAFRRRIDIVAGHLVEHAAARVASGHAADASLINAATAQP